MLRTARAAGVRPRLVLLDRGFYSVSVIRYLRAARVPFLMPVPLRGRAEDHPKGAGGTRVFSYWRRGGLGSYQLRESGGRVARVGVVVHCRNRAGRRGKHGRERLVYAYWGWDPPAPARNRDPLVAQQQREVRHLQDQLRQLRAGTTSRR